jgi:hypothetical protein
LNEEPARLEHMARYAVRPPVAADRVHEAADGRILLEIPPDPRTGDTVLLLHPLEFLRRMTNQIPAPRQHLVRYFGAYSNRLRGRYRDEDGEVAIREEGDRGGSRSRASWARLLRLVFEVDPLTCGCGAERKVISVITARGLVQKRLRHVRDRAEGETFDARAPPAPPAA